MFTIGYQGASLERLIESLAGADVSVVVDTRDTPHSRRPWEALYITVPWADLLDTAVKGAVGVILAQATKSARSRFKKWPKRPKYVAIHGPDGRILKSVRLKDPQSEPEDSTAEGSTLKWGKRRPGRSSRARPTRPRGATQPILCQWGLMRPT
jgi:hypothetical protein